MNRWFSCLVLLTYLCISATASAQSVGSIRGVIYDKDFDVPLAAAQVTIAETNQKSTATDEGNYILNDVPPGKYTVVFSKDGYARQVQADVVVNGGQLTDVDAYLSGEFTEMEEFVVQDLQIGGTEAGLLMLRVESPALLDSISSELISQAGAGDAASALKLVAGATVQDGKYAVIRGLPDRYVNSQMNNVRLPSADPDKRAVQLDQFPSEMIESVQVSKTFTPDQQGDASGGAVNVVLKGIPDEKVFKVKVGSTYNTEATGRDDFLAYKGGGVNFWGKDDGDRDLPTDFNNVQPSVVGVSRADAPINYDFAATGGGKIETTFDVKVGGFASVYYKRYSSYYNNGKDDRLSVDDFITPEMTPVLTKESPGEKDTRLLDIEEGSEEVQLGGMASIGVETEDHSVDVMAMQTRTAEDKATLAKDTRGKEHFFPGYDPTDPTDPGNDSGAIDLHPYLRFETLQYTERTTDTLQFKGNHKLSIPEIGFDNFFSFLSPEIEWTLAKSSSDLIEPDKRQFGSKWQPQFSGFLFPGFHSEYKPAANFFLGYFQNTWETVSEESDQYFINGKLPFEQWNGEEGYLKLGVFHDMVDRTFDQESFSNFNSPGDYLIGGYDVFWSDVWPTEGHTVTDGGLTAASDVDYKGEQEISAKYIMMDLPVWNYLKVIGGVRYEETDLSIVNDPEVNAYWVPLVTGQQTKRLLSDTPGAADVSFNQKDILPSYGLVINPIEKVTLRGSYSRTFARQTFKELSPIIQQEFLGGPVFIGNPDLQMSAVTNYDWRLDITPYEGGLFSVSWFKKDILDPIEYVQQATNEFDFTRPVNYPKGRLSGFEFEVRQQMGRLFEKLQGFSIGGNATFIDSEVTLPSDETNFFMNQFGISLEKRDMLNAPDHLYNAFLTYDFDKFGTKIGLFYTIKGDTLVEGAGQKLSHFVPDIYAKEYGTLNFTLSQKLGKDFELNFKAKNLLNPEIQEVYRSEFIGEDVVKTSYTQGVDYSLGISGKW